MLIAKKYFEIYNRFDKEIDPKEHKIFNELTEYAINYFKDKVEPNKKFKTKFKRKKL